MSGLGALELLRALGSGIRPGAASRSAHSAGTDFAALLQRASAGEVATGLSVRIAPGAGLSLSDGQLARLAEAADRAQAAGADRVLVLMDGRALLLDVATRTVTGEADMGKPGEAARVLAGLDGVVSVPGPAAGAGPVVGPPGGVPPASLTRGSERGAGDAAG